MAEQEQPESPPQTDGNLQRFRRFTRLPRPVAAVWFAPLLAIIALGSWALASPIGSSPDDDFHLTSAWCAQESPETCLPGDSPKTRTVPSELLEAKCFASHPDLSAACQEDLFDHAVLPSTASKRGNFNGGYPPVFYTVMGLFAGPDVPQAVLLMRMVNVLLFISFASVLFWLLPVARRSTLTWGWLITMVPLGVFLLASNNPSGWAISGVGSAFLATLGYFESRGRRRVAFAVLIFIATLIAAGSRGDAALYTAVAIGAVIALKVSPTKAFFSAAIAPLAATLVAFALLLTSRQASSAVGGIQGGAAPGSTGGGTGLQLFVHNARPITGSWTGVLGEWGLGWLDTSMPSIVPAAATAAFVAIGVTGLRVVPRRKALVLVGLVALLAAIPLFVLQRGGDTVGVDVQPRYLLPLIVILAFVLVFEPHGGPIAVSRAQRWVVVSALSIAYAVALFTNIRRYVTGTNNRGLNLSNGAQWWWDLPVTPMGVWAAGSLAFAALVVILVRETSRDAPKALSRANVEPASSV